MWNPIQVEIIEFIVPFVVVVMTAAKSYCQKGHGCPIQILGGFSPKLMKIHQFRDHLIVQILKSHSTVSNVLLQRQEYRIH